jgi:hypothetical protein
MEYLRKKIERELKEGDELTVHTDSFIYTGVFHGWIGDRTIYLEPSKISIITGQSQASSGVVTLNQEYRNCLINVENIAAILY